MKLDELFDKNGDIKGGSFDPYRESHTDPRCKLLFDLYGDLQTKASDFIDDFIENNLDNIGPFSDIIKLYHAEEFANKTKGNYSTIYYWR